MAICESYRSVHEVVATLGPGKTASLPYVHAFSGCDSTSAFVRSHSGEENCVGCMGALPRSSKVLSEYLNLLCTVVKSQQLLQYQSDRMFHSVV